VYFRVLHNQLSGFTSYLLGDSTKHEALLIDPRIADVAVTRAILNDQRLRLTSILFTHEHGEDHLENKSGNASVLAAYTSFYEGDKKLNTRLDNDLLTFGDEYLRIVKTPGHTRNCQSFLWRDRLFCGDLLTVDCCPHQPRPISADDLWNSVTQNVFLLPAETLLFSGHTRQARFLSSVLEQRLWHPWFAGATRDTFFVRVTAPANTSESFFTRGSHEAGIN